MRCESIGFGSGGRRNDNQRLGRLAIFAELFGQQPWRSRALLGLGLATVGLATYWGIFAWSPELVGQILGDRVPAAERQQMASSLAYLLMNFTGGLLGLLSFAPLASWRGRRFAFAVYHIGAAIVAPATFLGAVASRRPSGSCLSWRSSSWECTRATRFTFPSSSPRGCARQAQAFASISAGSWAP